MRKITIPAEWLQRAIDNTTPGSHVLGAVAVNWPELRLTEDQIVTNAVARVNGQPEPYPDNSIFAVELPKILVVRPE
jgi:hypothetical protein